MMLLHVIVLVKKVYQVMIQKVDELLNNERFYKHIDVMIMYGIVELIGEVIFHEILNYNYHMIEC